MQRNIIIACAALVILGGILAFLVIDPFRVLSGPEPTAAPPETTAPSGETPTATVEPPGIPGKPTDIDIAAIGDFVALDFAANKGMAYTITLQKTDDGEFTVGLAPGRAGFRYDPEKLLLSIRSAVGLDDCRLLQKNIPDEDMEQFGFDDPLLVWTIRTDDAAYTLEMGGQSGGGGETGGVYIREAGSNDVYILPYATAQAFTRAEYELRILQFLPEYQSSQEATEALIKFEVNGAREPFALRRLNEEESEENSLAAMYQFTAPTTWFCDSFYINKELLTPLYTLGFGAVVEDDPEDLAQYGLDEPYSIALADINGWEATLLIGAEYENGSGRFVMLEGVDTVFYDGGGDYSFLNINYTSLINKLFWIYNIMDVSRVDYEFGGVRHTLTYDVTEDEFNGTYDGQPVSEDNGRRLYIRTLQINLYDKMDDGEQAGDRYGAIAVTLRDGTTHTMELYTVSSRVYSVRFDGDDIRLTVHKEIIDKLIGLFDIIDRGDTIPM